jgi:CheY-like chemotaxis protein
MIMHILVVEDNDGDILLITEALALSKLQHEVSVVKNGQSAIDFLQQQHEYQTVKAPNLVLLDINLPRRNGHEVLHFIKNSAFLKHIPVIILTTSSSEKDMLASYRNYANCYITKPVEAQQFEEVITGIEQFWGSIANLPHNQVNK